jgi:hypothetical protein
LNEVHADYCAAPLLVKTTSRFCFTYMAGDADPPQALVWLDDSGHVVREDTITLHTSVPYVFARGDTVFFVLYTAEFSNDSYSHQLSLLGFTEDGARISQRVLFADTLDESGFLGEPCYWDQGGELLAAVCWQDSLTSQNCRSVRIVRNTAAGTMCCDRWDTSPLPPSGFLMYPAIAQDEQHHTVYTYSIYLNPTHAIRIEGVTPGGQPTGREITMDRVIDRSVTDMDVSVHDGEVYVAYTSMSFAVPDNSGMYVAGFPLDEFESVSPRPAWLPQELQLSAYPNPFNSTTRISLTLPVSEEVKIIVYDINGRLVQRLSGGLLPRGTSEFLWKATDLPSGTYLIRAQAGHGSALQKLILLR